MKNETISQNKVFHEIIQKDVFGLMKKIIQFLIVEVDSDSAESNSIDYNL